MYSTFVYGNLSFYASGSTKTCRMENFPWMFLLRHFQGIHYYRIGAVSVRILRV